MGLERCRRCRSRDDHRSARIWLSLATALSTSILDLDLNLYSARLGQLGKANVDGMRAEGGGEVLEGTGYDCGGLAESVQNEDAEWLVVSGVFPGNATLSIHRGVGEVHVWCSLIY